jgi:hypothetical protein
MSTPKTDEKTLQNNTIELLKSMGYTYIFPDDMIKYLSSTKEVLLKEQLKNKKELM